MMYKYPNEVNVSGFKCVVLFFILIFLLSCQRQEITESYDDGIPPATPAGLIIYAAFDGQVGLSWLHNNEADIYGYNIYRSVNDTLNFVFINFVFDNYYVDQKLYYDSIYYYKITAVDKFNRESKFSSIVSAQPKNIYRPLRPQYIRINAQNYNDECYIVINWSPSLDNDIAYYEIYRDTINSVEITEKNMIDTTVNNYYIDNNKLSVLTNYSYSIVAVDKGGLKSEPTLPVTDMILNKPVLMYPENNSIINRVDEFKFVAVSKPANYKLVIQTNPVYGIVYEYDFYITKVDTVIKINLPYIFLEPYRTYYWKIMTFTQEKDPNSISETFAFIYSL